MTLLMYMTIPSVLPSHSNMGTSRGPEGIDDLRHGANILLPSRPELKSVCLVGAESEGGTGHHTGQQREFRYDAIALAGTEYAAIEYAGLPVNLAIFI
ncbi:hypothetical protein ACXDF8_26555 [Mycolicibacterium sp. CBM1]